MCRLVAYLGAEKISLSSLILAPEHSLLEQSYAPREMLSGVVNADGFGGAWYDGAAEPAVYRSLSPIWSDATFEKLAPKVKGEAVFAALRNATPGLPSEINAIPPFTSGGYAFMHNGAIYDFRQSAMRPLRETLSDERYSGLLGASDSETLFACVLDRLDAGASLAESLTETLRLVAEVCRDRGVEATLNLALTDGEEMAFTRYSTRGPENSLYLVEDGRAFPGATVVASERLDGDEGWREVPSGSLLTFGRDSEIRLEEVFGG